MQLQVLQKWCMCYRRFILFQCTRTRLVKRITRGFCLLNNLSAWTLPPDRIVFGFLSTLGRTAQLSWHCPFTFVITQARPVFVSLCAWAGNEHKPNLQDCLRFLVDSWEDSTVELALSLHVCDHSGPARIRIIMGLGRQ